MKGIRNGIGLVLIGIIIIIYGCNSDDSEAPGISLSSPRLIENVYSAAEGETINVKVEVISPGGFKLLRVSFDGINRSPEDIVPSEAGLSSYTHNYTLENWSYGAQAFTISFQATDNSDKSAVAVITVEPGAPTIALTTDNPDIRNDTIIAFVNQEFEINYRYTFPAGFAKFVSRVTVDGVSNETVTTSLPPTQGTSVTDDINQTLNADGLGKDISFFFEITDKFGQTASLELPLSLTQKLSEILRDIELSYPSPDKDSKTFFSSNSGLTYTVLEVNADKEAIPKLVDFGYYYNDTDKASLTGPANYLTNPPTYSLGPNGEDWPALHVTNFKLSDISASEFDALGPQNQQEIIDAYNNASGNPVTVLKDIQVGNIVAFETDKDKAGGSKNGLLKVTNIITGSGSDGKMVFDVITNQ